GVLPGARRFRPRDRSDRRETRPPSWPPWARAGVGRGPDPRTPSDGEDVNDHLSKCAIPGLRSAAGIVVALGLAGTALGQNTALTINGQTAGNNTTSLNATAGSTLTIKVDNVAQANRPYGLFVGLANNGATAGGSLPAGGGGKKPMPVAPGVAPAVVEANSPPVDISPDRPSNPNLHLDALGHLVVSFLVPNTVVGTTFYFQA